MLSAVKYIQGSNYYPCTSNPQDAWHGYPVARSKDTPSDDFINSWIESGIISKKVGRAIQRGKL
jgi:hypothetical protein